MERLAILGCGWLGLPLAESLLAKGYAVKGSTTTPAKIPVLKRQGIDAHLIELTTDGIQGDMNRFLEGCNVLIIDIPPRSRTLAAGEFARKIEKLVPYILKSSVRQVLFISSTSVYGDNSGVMTEETPAQPDTTGGHELLQAERILTEQNGLSTSVLRFGGLIGPGRHPIYQLSGKQNLPNPSAAINLIDQQDCMGLVQRIIEKKAWGETFIGVAPYHPQRINYYAEKAHALGLAAPEFASAGNSEGKIIDGSKTALRLEYQYKNTTL